MAKIARQQDREHNILVATESLMAVERREKVKQDMSDDEVKGLVLGSIAHSLLAIAQIMNEETKIGGALQVKSRSELS